MGAPTFYNGKPLFHDGKPAFGRGCCCGGCCQFTGDEYIENFLAELGDIRIEQNGSSSLTGTGCDAEFTVPVTVSDVVTGDEYDTDATITSTYDAENGTCIWLVEIPGGALYGFTIYNPPWFIAADGCEGVMDCDDASGDCNGYDAASFEIVDPDGPLTCQAP